MNFSELHKLKWRNNLECYSTNNEYLVDVSYGGSRTINSESLGQVYLLSQNTEKIV